eukprot:scaffold239864_cov32-Tisochrysis_lutea.AAC.3
MNGPKWRIAEREVSQLKPCDIIRLNQVWPTCSQLLPSIPPPRASAIDCTLTADDDIARARGHGDECLVPFSLGAVVAIPPVCGERRKPWPLAEGLCAGRAKQQAVDLERDAGGEDEWPDEVGATVGHVHRRAACPGRGDRCRERGSAVCPVTECAILTHINQRRHPRGLGKRRGERPW